MPIHGKTLLERNMHYLADFGITNFVINVHYHADKVRAYLSDNQNFGFNVSISDETDRILETGGGLKKAEPFLKNKSSY